MSSCSPKTLKCGICGRVFDADLWDSVNTMIPALVELLLDGSLNTVTCPGCGTATSVSSPVLYNDMNRNLMIQIGNPGGAEQTDGEHAETDIVGVRYQQSLRQPTQLIAVQEFDLARAAIRALGDATVAEEIRCSHPDWPVGVVYAEAFLVHCRRLVAAGSF